ERYFEAYKNAIAAIAAAAGDSDDLVARPGISVKLSALHPRFEFSQRRRLMAELAPRLLELARRARAAALGLTVDSEEADRLDITLDLFEAVLGDDALGDWEGFGIAVQAYQKRAIHVIDWLAGLARRRGRPIPLRLVKGAYWDSEIKRAQVQGLDGYPVFTRKAATDVCYLACARRIAAAGEAFYPQFATHNAHAVAAVVALMGARRDYEFQRLHGMGEGLYAELVGADKLDLACRVYAPVGSHEDLLAYLVRRLLENGANTSFVNRIVDEALPIDEIIADPVERIAAAGLTPHPRIPLPERLYGAQRRNAAGLDLSDPLVLAPLAEAMAAAADGAWEAWPMVAGEALEGSERPLVDPADNRRVVGRVAEAGAQAIAAALGSAAAAAAGWDATPADERAACLERAAELIEEDMALFMAFCVREGGKSIGDALAEVREAVDFCRYYAERARADFDAPEVLPGPTGERNEVALHGRGVFACISPWNFPLAIFCGQVTAALAAGNAVIAKPAEQTPLIAAQAVARLHRAGVPPEVLHLLPGDGEVGAALVTDPRLAGVAFTGSTETARLINQSLAARSGAIVPLIAETGGQNAMIVDSSALPEQVVADVLRSAFSSAGQRCSALRVLFLQDEVASPIIEMLTGAMAELTVGDPGLLSTDVGPVIDAAALDTLEAHARRMADEATLLFEVALPAGVEHGTFFAPRAFEIASLDQLEREVFGPILHIIRYPAERLDEVCEAINRTGYGLTLGVHSRIDDTARHIRARVRAGNAYLNRNMIGAVVGVQPFGGEGLSGTGPKAGGPRYLYRFATERTLSVDTTAAGGNATLLSLGEEAG
ncbi:MAG: bifunctional proline dehydrogenase/L-glutamate gamma-semialdehyde dehydrogenase PutA, partial [Alphaproteobacteria bacterium]